jgi:hypothetical protein
MTVNDQLMEIRRPGYWQRIEAFKEEVRKTYHPTEADIKAAKEEELQRHRDFLKRKEGELHERRTSGRVHPEERHHQETKDLHGSPTTHRDT